MTKYIAFDAAIKTGYAYLPLKKYVTGTVSPKSKEALAKVFRDALSVGVDRVVIEDCYAGKSVKTLKSLQDSQTRITVEAERFGLPVELVYATTWQAAYGLTGKRADRKRGAMLTAKRLGADPKTQDEADAVCLLHYAESLAKQDERTQR